jgi:hypothetical protein
MHGQDPHDREQLLDEEQVRSALRTVAATSTALRSIRSKMEMAPAMVAPVVGPSPGKQG